MTLNANNINNNNNTIIILKIGEHAPGLLELKDYNKILFPCSFRCNFEISLAANLSKLKSSVVWNITP
jgi:hypothetical protein